MSETDRLEARLRAFAATPNDGADWDDVRRRAEGRLSVSVPRRRLVLALAAVVVVAASVTGVLVTRGTRPGATDAGGCSSALIWSCPGPSGPSGQPGAVGPGRVPDGSNLWGQHGRQISIADLHAEAPYIPLPSSDLANDSSVGTVWVWDHTSDSQVPVGHVAAVVWYPGSGIELLWTGSGLDYSGLEPGQEQTIDGVRAMVLARDQTVGPTGASGPHGALALSVLNLPVGPDHVLELDGIVPERELIDVARTLSPSPGDASPVGSLPPTDPQPGPYMTAWDGFLSDGVSEGSVGEAANSLAFRPVAPSSLGDPSAILVSDPAKVGPSDRVLSLRYDDPSMGRFWLLERPSLSTTTPLLTKIASDCTRATGCKAIAAAMVDLGSGVSALRLEDPVFDRVLWVDEGVYYEVVGNASTLTPADALSVARAVVAEAAG
jgi:hypothetical protein